MIKDESQYEFSKEWVEKFTKTIAAMEQDEEAKRKDFLKWDAGRGAIQCHLDQLNEEIAEYERLINCDKSEPIADQKKETAIALSFAGAIALACRRRSLCVQSSHWHGGNGGKRGWVTCVN